MNKFISKMRKLFIGSVSDSMVTDGFADVEMCGKKDCGIQVVRPGKFQCECDDILARVLDHADEYRFLPLGNFMLEIADEIRNLRQEIVELKAEIFSLTEKV